MKDNITRIVNLWIESKSKESEKSPTETATGPEAFTKTKKSDSTDNDPPKGPAPKGKGKGKRFSFLPFIFILFATLLLAGIFYSPKRCEIPIMQLVNLIEKGNPEKKISFDEYVKRGREGLESVTAPNILVEEDYGKKKIRIRYSYPDDICIGPEEVTGIIFREVIGEAVDQLTEKATENSAKSTADKTQNSSNASELPVKTVYPLKNTSESQVNDYKRIPFFSGRQGLNFDNNELFNQFKKNGFENVSALGRSGFWEKNGTTLVMSGALILILLFLLGRIGSGAMAFGQSRGALVAPEDVKVTFNDVAGVEEAVDELREIVDFLRVPEKFQLLGGRIPKGVLLVGPPGTGKTLLAKAVAGEAGVPFFSLSGSDFVELYAGVGAARVRDLFRQAQQNSPCIIFIDELDALGKTRSGQSFGAHDEREQTLNALLVEMDGFETNAGVIVMAATNRPEILDSALLRSGRFDRQVLVDRPDLNGREAILKIHSKNVKLDPELDLHKIACMTSGFAGADLAALVNEAALLAARADKNSVTMEEFSEGVERVTAGLQKKKRVITEVEKDRISWHECGHALVATLLPNTDPVHKVSIIPRGLAALGYTLQRPEDDRYLMTRKELEAKIQVLLAGTIAEEQILNDISTGARNDLSRAAALAREMVTSYGMSRLGPINFKDSRPNYENETGGLLGKEYSERTAWEIDKEVRRIIEELYQNTFDLLAENRPILEKLADELRQKEVLDADELKAIISGKTESNSDENGAYENDDNETKVDENGVNRNKNDNIIGTGHSGI